jgi:dTDP-4-dehydrorhamnose reductase
MKTGVLVLGRSGMLGHMVLKFLTGAEGLEVAGTHIFDPSDPIYFDVLSGLDRLDSICKTGRFRYLVNCIGITANQVDEKDSRSVLRAIRINAEFPHELAEFAGKRDMRVIHISTDGVFSGKAESYDEEFPCDCTDVYGKTKSLGEAVHRSFLTLRCSIIGPSPYEHGGLFEWFFSQPEGAAVSGYTNHFWNGITTLQFADLCLRIIDGNRFDALREESPLFHFAPNKPVSKHELLNLLKTAYGRSVAINPVEYGKGTRKRILKSRFRGLKDLYPHDTSVFEAIEALKQLK